MNLAAACQSRPSKPSKQRVIEAIDAIEAIETIEAIEAIETIEAIGAMKHWNYWAEARLKIARMTLTIKRDGNWSSFQLANSALPLSVTSSAIAPSARMLVCGLQQNSNNTI